MKESLNKSAAPINNKQLAENRFRNELHESIRSDRDALNVLGESTIKRWRQAKKSIISGEICLAN